MSLLCLSMEQGWLLTYFPQICWRPPSCNPVSQPTDRLFVDFVGPLVRSKRGNIAILVVDSLSKFVSFCPVRKITSQAVSDHLERGFFQLTVRLSLSSLITLGFPAVRTLKICVLDGGLNTTITPIILKLPWRKGLTGI